jgi:hypothetical protein
MDVRDSDDAGAANNGHVSQILTSDILISKISALMHLATSSAEWTVPVSATGGIVRATLLDGTPSCKGSSHFPFHRAAIKDLLLSIDAKKEIDGLFDCGHRQCSRNGCAGRASPSLGR